MSEGFIPDATYGQILQTYFDDGSLESSSFLGISTGLKVDKEHMHPMHAFRCVDCGLVRLYA